MASKRKSSENTRQRIRNMAVSAMRDRDLSAADIRKLVNDSLSGAAKTINHEVPAARRRAMRDAFEGLRDAFGAVAAAGTNTGKSAKRRGKDIADHALPAAKRKILAANDEFLGAVSSFAKKTSTELGEELEALVRRARKAGRSVADSASTAGKVAAKNAGPMASDAGRAGWSLARKAAEQVALAASGLLEGIGQLLAPTKMNEQAASPKPRKHRSAKKKTSRRSARSASKPSAKASVKSAATSAKKTARKTAKSAARTVKNAAARVERKLDTKKAKSTR